MSSKGKVNATIEQKGKEASLSVDKVILAIGITGNVENLGLEEIGQLAGRAKSGSLSPDEFEGGTCTLSNLGMFGLKSFDAIINPPQAAILAIGAGEKRSIIVDNEQAIASMMTISMSADHRVIDGALAARFLKVLKHLLEHPAILLK